MVKLWAKYWAISAISVIGIVIGEVFFRPLGKGYHMINNCIFLTLDVIIFISWTNIWLHIKKVWKE